MSIAFAVQKAMDAILVPAMAALSPSVSVFDHVPSGQGFPFVQFSRVIATPENLVADKVTRVQIALTVYSDFRGQEQVLTILAAIESALDDIDLVLETGQAVRCDIERADTVRDQDGVTYSGTALFSVLVDN